MAGGLLMSVLWIAFMCLHQSLQQEPPKCDPGRYGQNCEKQCSAGCPGGQCDHVTGRCNDYDCLPGWWSGYRRCDQACGHGRYGKGCSKLCNNGCKDGMCNRINGSCDCWMGWTGQKCDVCPEGHYVHGRRCKKCSEGCQPGTCGSDGACTCLPGWTGSHCRTDVKECQSSPCQNRGTCHDAVNSYTCTCRPGYTGVHCEEDIDECESNPCQNGGTCENTDGSYICHCPPGFRGGDCGQECGKGYYGQDCRGRCGEGCDGGECDKVTGHCQCRSVRWTGQKCDACDEGYYRTTVQQSSYPYTYIPTCIQCGEGCEAGRCDTSNGHCECQPGWTTRTHEKTCDRKCRSGTYGSACRKRCGQGCENGICDHVNGECNCRSDRWTGPTCDECRDGYHGYGCSQSCGFCADDKPCDKRTGHCERCKGNKQMPFCKADCEDGTFGDSCLKDCGHCAEGGVCDKTNGHCTACEPGWKPPLCSDKCEDGYYGQHCGGRCGHCQNDDVCDVVTGFCPAGCQDRFHGLRCDSPTQTHTLYVVVGVSSAVVVVLLAVVAVVVYRTRRVLQAPGTADRIADAKHEEAGAQGNLPDPEMGGNLPRLPGEEDGTYSDATNRACSPSANARAREAQPAAVATATAAPPYKESGGVDSRKGRTPGRNKPLGGRRTPLRNREDEAFGFGRGHPGKKPLQAAAMANDPQEQAQASFPSYELASIFSPHPTEDLAGDVPYENVGFPAQVLANYERPTVYVNTAEDRHLYDKSQASSDNLYDDCSETRVQRS